MPKWWNWYTRTTQNRVAQAMRVRVSPWAQNMKIYESGFFYFVRKRLERERVRENGSCPVAEG